MNTILVPTDFTDNAWNAAAYAANISKISGAKILLAHAWHVPITDGTPYPTDVLEEMEAEDKDDLKKIVEKLREIVPSNIIIETTEVAGFAADEIVDLAKESNAGLIVLGAQTEGNLVEKLIGMVTTEVLRRASCPVLIVPQKAKFKEIKSISLACNDAKMINEHVKTTIQNSLKTFNSNLHLIGIAKNLKDEELSLLIECEKARNILGNANFPTTIKECPNVADGIIESAKSVGSDMVILLPGKHGFIERLFGEIHTRHLALHTDLPLLVIPQHG